MLKLSTSDEPQKEITCFRKDKKAQKIDNNKNKKEDGELNFYCYQKPKNGRNRVEQQQKQILRNQIAFQNGNRVLWKRIRGEVWI